MRKILKSSFRYLVPFTYEIADGGYDKFSCELQKDGKWTERPFWEKESNKSSERDVYPYIYALFTGGDSGSAGAVG